MKDIGRQHERPARRADDVGASFRYAPLKVLGKRKQIILRIEFTQNFGLDCIFTGKYLIHTVTGMIYCTIYVLCFSPAS